MFSVQQVQEIVNKVVSTARASQSHPQLQQNEENSIARQRIQKVSEAALFSMENSKFMNSGIFKCVKRISCLVGKRKRT
jgi:hypothetical protein